MATQTTRKKRRPPNLKKKDDGRRILPAHRPNAGIRARYERKLLRLVSGLTRRLRESAEQWYGSRTTERQLFERATVGDAKGKTRKQQQQEWRDKYMWDKYWTDDGWYEREAETLAEWFARVVGEDAGRQWNKGVKDIGLPEFRVILTDDQKDLIAEMVTENIELIRSVKAKYLGKIEMAVNESMAAGVDLKTLTEKIKAIKGVTDRRAALIARDQTNKATSSFNIAMSRAAGAKKGIWVHSLARKHPRKSHLEAGQKRLEFDLEKGAPLWDESLKKFRNQFPGQEINCGCTYRSIFVIGGQEFR